MNSVLMHRAIGFVDFLKFMKRCLFFELLVFKFFSLFLIFLSFLGLNPFYRFLKSPFTLIVNSNSSKQTKFDKLCEAKLVHTPRQKQVLLQLGFLLEAETNRFVTSELKSPKSLQHQF